MRAFAVGSFGEAPAVRELPVPAVDGTFLIRVTYAGVNPLDYKLVEQLTPDSSYPFVVGVDFAGVVERAPTRAHDIRVGDRVFGIARTHGAYAEYTAVAPAVSAEPLAPTPDGVSDEEAAALPIAGITALRSLQLLDITTAGQRVVVIGATGGVGGYAVQIARSFGASVTAIVRGDIDEARRLGADEVFDTNSGDVFAAVSASHPKGVDAVLDLVDGPGEIHPVARILRPGGRLVSALYAADESWFAARQVAAYNIASLTNPLSSPAGLSEVAGMVADGAITVRIRLTAELDNAGQVLERVRTGGLRGKAVIRL